MSKLKYRANFKASTISFNIQNLQKKVAEDIGKKIITIVDENGIAKKQWQWQCKFIGVERVHNGSTGKETWNIIWRFYFRNEEDASHFMIKYCQ